MLLCYNTLLPFSILSNNYLSYTQVKLQSIFGKNSKKLILFKFQIGNIEAPNRTDIIKNTRNIKQHDGHELSRRWDMLTERLYAPVEINQNGQKTNVVIGTRMYSNAQYQLLFRISGFIPVITYDEELNLFCEEAQRMIFVVKKV